MGDPIIEAAARKGSAELLILSALEDGQLHGYDIAREISRRSGGLLTFHVASLYPLLYKLEDRSVDCGTLGRESRATPAALLPSHCRGPESARETAQPLGSVRRRADQGRRVETCLSHRRYFNRFALRERLAAEGDDSFRARGGDRRDRRTPRTICIARRSRKANRMSRPTRWLRPSWRAWVRSRWPSPIARRGARAVIRRPRTGAPVSPRMSVTRCGRCAWIAASRRWWC